MNLSRRHFLENLGLVAATGLISNDLWAETLKKSNLKIAYSAITWGGKDDVAIKELASLGFKGIQLRANTFGPYRRSEERRVGKEC